MSDATKFDRIIRNVQKKLKQEVIFLVIDNEVEIEHPVYQEEEYLKIDNLAQIGKSLFIFEGKTKQEQRAQTQLHLYLRSLTFFPEENIKRGGLFPYNNNLIRLFYYSIDEQELVEYIIKGNKFLRTARKWKDGNELQGLLRKIFKGQRQTINILMKTAFVMERQKDVDTLTKIVRELVKGAGLITIKKGAMRSTTRPIDFRVFDFALNDTICGHYEFEKKNGAYQVIFEMDIKEIYDEVINAILMFYQSMSPPKKETGLSIHSTGI